MKKNKIYMILLLLGMLSSAGCKGEDSIETRETEVIEDLESTEEAAETEIPKTKIYVQVSGAVANPGVYELQEDSRVFEAIEMAGGLTGEAEASMMNQAQVLQDGQMVYVPKQGEAAQFSEAQSDDGKVNLNTATVEQLMTLSGIGRAKAESIVAWRGKNGSFTRIEDLMEIEGIKEGVFSKIKDSIKVN